MSKNRNLKEDYSLKDEHSKFKTILGNRSIGKGMRMSMAHNTNRDGRDELIMFNTYFNGTVMQTFNNPENTTRKEYRHSLTYSPKWLKEKTTIKNGGYYQIDLVTANNVHLHCSHAWISCTLEYTDKGLTFDGNITNINNLKKTADEVKWFKNMLKNNSIKELQACSLPAEHSHHIKLDYKLIKTLK